MNRDRGFISFFIFYFFTGERNSWGGSFTVAIITCIVWCFCLGFFFSLWVWVFSLPEYRKLEPWSCVLFEISFFLASYCFSPDTFTLLYLFYHALLARDTEGDWEFLITVRGDLRPVNLGIRKNDQNFQVVLVCREPLRTNTGGLMASSCEEKRRVYRLCLAVEYFFRRRLSRMCS